MSSTNKRHSILPPVSQSGPRAPVNFSSSLTISDNAILTGAHPITIQSESVIHPRARLESTGGAIIIGRRCIIHERTHIGANSEGDGGGVTLGDYVTVEVAAVIEAGGTDIGEGCNIGIGAKIGSGAVLGKHCTITPKSTVAPGETISDFMVVYSNNKRRTDRRGVADLKHKAQARQIEVLRKMIPSNPAKFQ